MTMLESSFLTQEHLVWISGGHRLSEIIGMQQIDENLLVHVIAAFSSVRCSWMAGYHRRRHGLVHVGRTAVMDGGRRRRREEEGEGVEL